MISKHLKPKFEYDLVRLGKNNDGGYLVEKNSIQNTKTLISFGINDDWSFEEHFLQLNQCELHAFDYSIGLKVFLRKVIENFTSSIIFIFWRPKIQIFSILNSVQALIKFLFFFRKNRFFYKKMVGGPANESKSLIEALGETNFNCPIFLKCDIEGSEYRILEELINLSESLSGVVIEFHDVDLHMEKILKFVKDFALDLVHIHPNNCGGLDINQDPLVIEIMRYQFVFIMD